MKKAIWRSGGYLILVLIVGSICAGLEGLLSIFTMHAVDAVYAKNQPAFLGALTQLLQTAGLLVPTTIALAFARGFYKRKAVVSGKKNYIRRLFQKNINEFQSENNAKYMSTLTNDVNIIESSYVDALYEMLISIINFTVAILVIGTVSPLALGLGVVIGGISTLASILISKPVQRHQHQRSELYEDYTAYIKEVLEDNLVLSEINLSFKKGGKYLVIGPSGGGKSTLLRLLRKYYLPQKGQIRLDQQDLKDIQKNSYFKHIANVEQQVFLFEDTIRNNMTLYKDYEDEEILAALSSAGLMPFIESNPEGLNYMIYDNGKNLSGGERSRMAIARALLQQADLLILDEAFSSLDSHTAKGIEKTILSLPTLTVVNVSHVLFEENRKDYTEIITVKNQKTFVTKSSPVGIS